MRILADENIPRASIALLRSAGHDVVAVAEAHRGKKDATVLQQASADSRVLLTFDGDFGRLIFCQDAAMPGGVIIPSFCARDS